MDFAHWTCPDCGHAIEGERVVDETFLTRVTDHKAEHNLTDLAAMVQGAFDRTLWNTVCEELGISITSQLGEVRAAIKRLKGLER